MFNFHFVQSPFTNSSWKRKAFMPDMTRAKSFYIWQIPSAAIIHRQQPKWNTSMATMAIACTSTYLLCQLVCSFAWRGFSLVHISVTCCSQQVIFYRKSTDTTDNMHIKQAEPFCIFVSNVEEPEEAAHALSGRYICTPRRASFSFNIHTGDFPLVLSKWIPSHFL